MSATNPSHGMKVKTDPAGRQNPIREGAGPVTSDSLAAESTRSGGAFAENRDAKPLAVKGANSTFNTTDTSAADELPPAVDAAHRPGPEEELPGLGKGYVAGARKGSGTSSGAQGDNQQQQKTSGDATSDMTTTTASSDGKASSEHGTTAGKASGDVHEAGSHSTGKHHGHHGGKKHHQSTTETTDQPESAPTYVSADILDQPVHQKPKGRNVTEGGIEDDAPNASFTAEIGSQDDPGRLAELKFQAAVARSAPDAGSGPTDTKVSNDGQFNALNDEEAP